MKTRVITAAVAIPALLLLLMAAPTVVTAIVWGVLLGIAAYELLYSTGLVREPHLVLISAVMAFAVSLWSHYDAIHAYGQIGLMIFAAALFGEMMLSHVKITFDKVCMCMTAGFVIPFLLSSLIRILVMSRIGRYMVLVPFVIAFTSDAGAYFAGRFFGHHKLSPVISQHKTIEGAIGGIAGSALVGALYSYFIVDSVITEQNVTWAFILISAIGAMISQIGDLAASAIKRNHEIKDYGKLIPGHGGVMDRFDSVIFTAPMIYLLVIILIRV